MASAPHFAAWLILLQCGPPLVLFLGIIAPRSLLILVTLSSAFLWSTVLLVLSALLGGLLVDGAGVWQYAVIVTAAVALEEAVRWWLYSLYRRACRLLDDLASKNPGWRFSSADQALLTFGIGYGQATAHALALSVAWLPLAAGKGVLYVGGCRSMSYAPAAAFTMLGIFCLHAGSTVVAFAGREDGSTLQTAAPGMAHLAAALLTVLNVRHDTCVAVAGAELVLGCAVLGAAGVVCCRQAARQRRGYARVLEAEDPVPAVVSTTRDNT